MAEAHPLKKRCLHKKLLLVLLPCMLIVTHCEMAFLWSSIQQTIPGRRLETSRSFRAWQNFPTRAQGIYILGTNMVTRVVINGLIAFASLFAKNKVIARIKFAELKDIEKKWGARDSLL